MKVELPEIPSAVKEMGAPIHFKNNNLYINCLNGGTVRCHNQQCGCRCPKGLGGEHCEVRVDADDEESEDDDEESEDDDEESDLTGDDAELDESYADISNDNYFNDDLPGNNAELDGNADDGDSTPVEISDGGHKDSWAGGAGGALDDDPLGILSDSGGEIFVTFGDD